MNLNLTHSKPQQQLEMTVKFTNIHLYVFASLCVHSVT